MLSLDPRSLIVMAGFMSLVMAVVLGFMRRYYPPNIQGLGYWAWTPVAWIASAGIIVAHSGEWLGLVRLVGNGMLIGGFSLFHLGCRRFFAQPSAWQRVLTGWGVTLLALVWFTWVSPSYAMRRGAVPGQGRRAQSDLRGLSRLSVAESALRHPGRLETRHLAQHSARRLQ